MLAVETSTYLFGRLNVPHNKGLPCSKKYRDSKDDKGLTREEPAYWLGGRGGSYEMAQGRQFSQQCSGLGRLVPL